MSEIMLTDGSVLMNATFNDVRFVLDAKDKNIILDSCEFNRCTFDSTQPDRIEGYGGLTCIFCVFKDCQGIEKWYKVILEVEL